MLEEDVFALVNFLKPSIQHLVLAEQLRGDGVGGKAEQLLEARILRHGRHLCFCFLLQTLRNSESDGFSRALRTGCSESGSVAKSLPPADPLRIAEERRYLP